MEIPEWLKVGEYVAVDNRDRILLKKVERFTKTLVVLEGDLRFRLDTLRRRTGGTWDPDDTLHDPNDVGIRGRLRAQKVRGLFQRVEMTGRDYYRKQLGQRPDAQLEVLRKQSVELVAAIDALLGEN